MSDLTDRIKNDFTNHTPTNNAKLMMGSNRAVLREMALAYAADLPDGREKSLAITHLEEAMFWSNAAIARCPQNQAKEEN